jgi:hypothetical protein
VCLPDLGSNVQGAADRVSACPGEDGVDLGTETLE